MAWFGSTGEWMHFGHKTDKNYPQFMYYRTGGDEAFDFEDFMWCAANIRFSKKPHTPVLHISEHALDTITNDDVTVIEMFYPDIIFTFGYRYI